MSKRSLIALLTALLVVNQIKAANLKHIAGDAKKWLPRYTLALLTGEQLLDRHDKHDKWPKKQTDQFKSEVLKNADHKLDQAFLDKITFTDNTNNRRAYSIDFFSKNPVINIPSYEINKSKSLLRYTLLHEIGHIYNKDYINHTMMLLACWALSCIPNGFKKQLATTPFLVILFKLNQRYCENRADDFAIECLSRQGDAQGLRNVANYYRPTDWYISRTLTRLGIEPTRFYDIKAKAPLASKFIQLIDDEHLPIEEMCMKFDLAALKVDAQNKIKE